MRDAHGDRWRGCWVPGLNLARQGKHASKVVVDAPPPPNLLSFAVVDLQERNGERRITRVAHGDKQKGEFFSVGCVLTSPPPGF